MSNQRWLPTAVALIVVGSYTTATVRYAGVWSSELTLWTHAAARAPLKPRPHGQLALAQMERRQFATAWASLDRVAAILATQPIPAWDRAEATTALRANQQLLSRLDPPGGRGR